jgi:hypothetical protein
VTAKSTDFIDISFLGIEPKCDICGVSLKEGDIIKQVYHGRVYLMHEEQELAVAGEYEVFHVACNPLTDGK